MPHLVYRTCMPRPRLRNARTKAGAGRFHECSNICDLYRSSRSNPIAAIFRGGAKLSLRASFRLKNLMRQSMKHPNPYLAISSAVFSKPAFRHRSCAAATQSLLARGFQAEQPSRVDSVAGKLVVSAPYSKRYFCTHNGGLRFSQDRNPLDSWRQGCKKRARDAAKVVLRRSDS